MNDLDTYLTALSDALTRRGLDPGRTGEVIDEVRAHLTDTGQAAADEFGDPDSYADALLAADPGESGDPGANGESSEPVYEARTFRATATDEMRILAELGRDGWELTGVRDFGLHARRPVAVAARHVWTYQRRTAIRREPLTSGMGEAGWQPCGRWTAFFYFKRVVQAP